MPLAGDFVEADDAVADSWTDYTPTVSGATSGGTLGNGVINGARYMRVNGLVVVQVDITWGSTTSFGTGSGRISLPVSARAANPAAVGSGWLADTSAGTAARWSVTAVLLDVDNLTMVVTGSGNMSATVPFTWTTSDVMRFTAMYEPAA